MNPVKKKLLVLAGTGVEFKNNRLYTKTQFNDYFYELSNFYDVTWITNEYKTNNFKSEIKSIKVIRISKSFFKIHLFKTQWLIFINAFSFDRILIFLPGGFMLFPSVWLIKLFSYKLYTYIGVDFENQKYSDHIIIQYFWRWTLRFLLRHSRGVICRGEFLLKKVAEINRKKSLINTIPLAVINKKTILKLLSGKEKYDLKQLLYVGQVKRSKGIFNLITAIKELKDKTFKLNIIGTGTEFLEAKELVAKFDLEEQVKFSGWIDDQEEMASIYNFSSILIQPSIEPEGVPRTIDEAIFYGTPVIATKVGGINLEFSDEEIIKINPNSINELKLSITNAMYSLNNYLKYHKSTKKRKDFINQSSPAIQHFHFIESSMLEK